MSWLGVWAGRTVGQWFGPIARETQSEALPDITGGGPDRADELDAHRFTEDRSGWRRPQWVRAREQAQLEQLARVPIEVKHTTLSPAVARSDVPPAADLHQAIAATPEGSDVVSAQAGAGVPTLLDVERARIAAKVRQQRELEEIMTVLMMAA